MVLVLALAGLADFAASAAGLAGAWANAGNALSSRAPTNTPNTRLI
jgi:hypothetical protein